MNRRIHGICASALVALGLAGCTMPDAWRVNVWENEAAHKAGTPCVNGSLEVAAQNTQGILNRLGIAAIASEEGGKFILKCTTKKGDRFAIVLERWNGNQGAQTHVDFAWEGPVDQRLQAEIWAALVAASGGANLAK
jgi:hypothetical protein